MCWIDYSSIDAIFMMSGSLKKVRWFDFILMSSHCAHFKAKKVLESEMKWKKIWNNLKKYLKI